MAIPDQKSQSDGKVWGFFKLPFRGNNTNTTSSSSTTHSSHLQHHHNQSNMPVEGSNLHTSGSVSSVARSLLPTRRRLRLDPSNKLYFPWFEESEHGESYIRDATRGHRKSHLTYVHPNSFYEPGKQVRSAIRIKNTSKSHVAFKFQTTAPKSCFMRPPGAILAPGESLIATVFKFVEHPENNEKPMEQKSKVKFKIMSLKVKGPMDYVPEMFDELKDQVAVEQILRVVFLDVERPSPALDKLKRQLAEAEAAVEARKKPPEEAGPRIIGEGLVIDEWKERRERYLARQQVEGVDSV